ncbi:hypothetical protein HZS_7002 [Henneguya salminicola]|nr:hypothetical protein HZS_7002 [Henneguya salminicola]
MKYFFQMTLNLLTRLTPILVCNLLQKLYPLYIAFQDNLELAQIIEFACQITSHQNIRYFNR